MILASFLYLVSCYLGSLRLHDTISSIMHLSVRGKHRGFTLIELLLVIGIIAVLAGIVVGALSPTKQLGSSRNAKRQSDVNSILNAVYQYVIDNERLPAGIPTGAPAEICRTSEGACAYGVDLSVLSGAYLVSIPIDPQITTGTGTHYFIKQDNNGRLTVTAPHAENDATISVTR
jgi:prepilin-type N-terminal cleavage/methylation domain-containing protein